MVGVLAGWYDGRSAASGDSVMALAGVVNAGVNFPISAEVKFLILVVFGCQPFSVTCGFILRWRAGVWCHRACARSIHLRPRP